MGHRPRPRSRTSEPHGGLEGLLSGSNKPLISQGAQHFPLRIHPTSLRFKPQRRSIARISKLTGVTRTPQPQRTEHQLISPRNRSAKYGLISSPDGPGSGGSKAHFGGPVEGARGPDKAMRLKLVSDHATTQHIYGVHH